MTFHLSPLWDFHKPVLSHSSENKTILTKQHTRTHTRCELTSLCFISPQINCVTFPVPMSTPEQQLLKPNEWSYCDYFWVRDREREDIHPWWTAVAECWYDTMWISIEQVTSNTIRRTYCDTLMLYYSTQNIFFFTILFDYNNPEQRVKWHVVVCIHSYTRTCTQANAYRSILSGWFFLASQAKRVKRLWHFCHVWFGTSAAATTADSYTLTQTHTHREKHIPLTHCIKSPHITLVIPSTYTHPSLKRKLTVTPARPYAPSHTLIHANPRCDSHTLMPLTCCWQSGSDDVVACVKSLCPL